MNAKLSNMISELAEAQAKTQEYFVALEDASSQLSVLRGTVTLSASDEEILHMQQQHREVTLALELAQHEANTEKQMTEVLKA